MNARKRRTLLLAAFATLLALSGCGGNNTTASQPAPPTAAPATYQTTASQYQPQQEMTTYEQTPAGFSPVYTEAIVRHGSRGISSFDASVYNMWLKAEADGALTTLGAQLGPDLLRMMKANALLG